MLGAGVPRRTLAEVVVEYRERRPLDAALPRERLIGLARTYLARAEREADEA